jgi:hypothetical protein
MKNKRKTLKAVSLAFLLMSITAPLVLVNNVNAAEPQRLHVSYGSDGKWMKIQTDLITILFPAGGKKPMFLWWYANDTSNIYVVKYKGLIEYTTLDYEYYRVTCEANQLTIQERLEAKYATPMPEPYRTIIRNRIRAYLGWVLGLHPALLPFSACRWNLTGPVEVTRDDGVSYISFNFTLVKAPLIFDFADGNVIIRCRFYATDATESAHGLYNYTVKAGELKMDFVVQNWEWNIDKLNDLFEILQKEYNATVPKLRAGLALWVDMASLNLTKLSTAEQDANTMLQTQTLPESVADVQLEPVEANSGVSDIIAGEQRIQVKNRIASETAPLNVRTRLHERFKLRFAKESQTLAGFFDFVNTALVINSTTNEPKVVNVTAAYMQAGNHLRLFIGYPYFGSNILEHDPSIGVEQAIPILPKLLWILVGATIVIGVAVAAVKLLKKPVNILAVK